ncbi:hypothetical protein TrLO_g3775 [Triparma laevis f. longispina]|uniref:Phosphatidate cytidylyltransferase n=1 Tax=Triparma laevis f. longispina TaxID=1714387 RepID=A0A9W7KYN9_9STRA|nr:hypothetical protein TrLO_g3775 [Triparma laevis f. longispina]
MPRAILLLLVFLLTASAFHVHAPTTHHTHNHHHPHQSSPLPSVSTPTTLKASHRYSPRRISSKYSSYLTRLWTETSMGSRKSLTRKKLVKSCKILEKLLDTDVEFRDEELVIALRSTISTTLKRLDEEASEAAAAAVEQTDQPTDTAAAVTASKPLKQKKKGRSVLRGALMGLAVAVWIATTFLGMFYIGYLPSFWVSVRMLGVREHTRLAPIAAPILSLLGRKATSLPAWLPAAFPLPITQGAIFTFWCWLAIAFSDVGAYFSGRKYGKTKLGEISRAAGETSPNKTVEGVIGGCLTSGSLGMLGAWVMKWPYPYLSGSIHGVILALLGLVGDLTASMLKRDAGLKDFGDLIPEHGGVLDRVDSFIFSAPYAYFVIKFCLPWLKTLAPVPV